MKKMLLAVLSILIGLQSFAYPATGPGSFADRVTAPRSAAYPSPAISEQLLKNFKESFPHAERVVWNESADRYTVSFVEQNILNRITYEKNGDFAGSIRYYTERSLPYYLINVVKNKYPRQKIYGVTEITAPSGILYYLKLEGPKYWLTIALDSEGQTSVQDKYRKAQ